MLADHRADGGPARLPDALRAILEASAQSAPPGLSLQALAVLQYMPDPTVHNVLDLPPAGTTQTPWINPATTIVPHVDRLDNIACVAAGRRRLMLFLPDQPENFHLGPLHVTPLGDPSASCRPNSTTACWRSSPR